MIATLFGGVGGIALGVTGGAGAIITLPLLVYGLHVPVHQAVLFSLFVVGFSALLGLMPFERWRDLDKKAVLLLSLGALCILPFASYFSEHVKKEYLLFIFSFFMIGIGCFLLFSERALSRLRAHVRYVKSQQATTMVTRWHILFLFGGIFGFLTGFLGIGGGIMMVPCLVFLLMIPFPQATSTSLMVILITSSVAIITHIRHESVNWYVLGSYLIGSAAGVWLGAMIANKVPKVLLHRLIGISIICIASMILYTLRQ